MGLPPERDSRNVGERTEPMGVGHDGPLRRAAGSALGAGEVLAGRFRIASFLGEGAVGEVYEAEDLELGGRVAVKTLHPAIAGDARAMLRFKREIQLARQVTHPNVCRIFDLFHHRRTGAAPAEVIFLTMELLRGEPLSERLARGGRMTAAAALPFAREMAAALAAAHAAGIVHRDFKSGNVMLVDQPGGTRAVVTDFGLAQSSTAASSLTGTGTLVGSPAYMSPEQVTGSELTAASDIYSFGVVLYEMVTGSLPFTGETAFLVALKRLEEAPPTPRATVPDLDPRWEDAILRCLEREPGRRFAGAAEVAAALSAAGPVARHPWRRRARPPLRPGQRRWRRAALTAAWGLPVLGLLALGAVRLARPPADGAARPAGGVPPAAASAGRTERPAVVAVLGFQNLAREPAADYLDDVLREMLPDELAPGGRLQVLSGEDVGHLRRDLALPAMHSLSAATLLRVRRASGADLVVTGSYLVASHGSGGSGSSNSPVNPGGGSAGGAGSGGAHSTGGADSAAGTSGTGGAGGAALRLDVTVQSTETGATVATVHATGSEPAILETLARLGVELRRALGVPALSDAEAQQVQAAHPATAEAARFYAEGLARLRQGDGPAAVALLQQAVQADPRNPMSRSALAAAWSYLGYDSRAEQAAREAFELAAGLPREERQLIEARYRAAARQWDRATAIYGALWGFVPDNLEYGLLLAGTETRGGNGRAALVTVAQLRRLPPPARSDPRIDLAEAEAAAALSDFRLQERAAAAAARKAAARGARGVAADARFLAGQALASLGDMKGAQAAYDEAAGIARQLRDRSGEARALHAAALLLLARGESARGEAVLEQALATYRALGNKGGEQRALCDLAQAQLDHGELSGAAAGLEQALALTGQTNDRLGAIDVLARLGRVRREQGDLAAAEARFEEALRLARQVANPDQVAQQLASLAYFLRSVGNLQAAEARLGEALAVFRAAGDRRRAAAALKDLGILQLDRGDLAAASRSHREAMAICRELGWRDGIAVNVYTLAEIDFYRGDLAAARQGAAEATALYQSLAFGNFTAMSQMLLAAADLALGHGAAAAATARAAAQQFAAAGAREDAAAAQALAAQALLRSGRPADAAAAVERARDLIRGSRDADDRLEVETAAAEVATARGRPAAAVQRLAAALAAGQAARLPVRLEARLALGRGQIAAGDLAGGRATLDALAREAGAKGFAYLAAEAARSAAAPAPVPPPSPAGAGAASP